MTNDGANDVVLRIRALAAALPTELGSLAEIAFNYRWSWMPSGPDIFRALDPDRWLAVEENPVRLLLSTPAARLQAASSRRELQGQVRTIRDALRTELLAEPAVGTADRPTVCLCAEFAIHRSLPIYSGGLGVVAGDLLKEASDSRVPMVGVGLFYRDGYFHQEIDESGWQQELPAKLVPDYLPVAAVTAPDDNPLTVSVVLRGRDVAVRVWRADVGRVPLYLLDCDHPGNADEDRVITSRLYVEDRDTRLAQYAVLGIASVRALYRMGIIPGILHLNEGHAAFAPLELARQNVAAGASPDEAIEMARRRTVFTTHTPTSAGNEAFFPEDVLEMLGDFAQELDLSPEELLDLGRVHRGDAYERFVVTVSGLRSSAKAGGVSRRHGEVARAMWSGVASSPGGPSIGHVTNGVHVSTWMAPPMRDLLSRWLGVGWQEQTPDPAAWRGIDVIPARELWNVRYVLRSGLINHLRHNTSTRQLGRGASARVAGSAADALDADILTIGFARRVVEYKRLTLLIQNLLPILQETHAGYPVQIVVSGKAHPEDRSGKRIVSSLFDLSLEADLAARAVFLVDYDVASAAYLVSGCDLWVNLPRPPLEACGSSGMKAALNGGLNLSVLDGWWAEGYDGLNGWAIRSSARLDAEAQDVLDSVALRDVLKDEILPEFYNRGRAAVPTRWVDRIKRSLRTIAPRFCAKRMLEDYVTSVYELDNGDGCRPEGCQRMRHSGRTRTGETL